MSQECDKTTLTISASAGLQLGDWLTISGIQRRSLWRRLLRLPAKPSPLYCITAISSSTIFEIESAFSYQWRATLESWQSSRRLIAASFKL